VVDLLKKGSAWLEQQRHTHMASPVTYSRGEHSVELQATVGRSEIEQQDANGTLVVAEPRDYLIRCEGLVLDGATRLPQPGDLITEAVGGNERTFEVMAIGSEPCWRYSDQYHQTFRIHTKAASEFAPHS